MRERERGLKSNGALEWAFFKFSSSLCKKRNQVYIFLLIDSFSLSQMIFFGYGVKGKTHIFLPMQTL